jgi:18S rRNA (adenine1779-N6/adenine1780-N6)-dimethyltransferase
VRKNRTKRASWLGTKEVLAMIERNYRIWCATNDVAIDDTIIGDEDEMDVDRGLGTGAEEDEWEGIMDDGEGHTFFLIEAKSLAFGWAYGT